MKKVFFASLMLMLFASANAQSPSLDVHINKLVDALKSKDENAFVKLFPGYEEMKNLLRTTFEKMSAMSEEKINIDSVMEKEFKKMTKEKFQTEMQEGFKKSFREFVESGEKKGITWENIGFIGFNIDTSDKINEMNMLSAQGVLEISENDQKYKIHFREIIWMDDVKGWYGIDLKRFVAPGDPDIDQEITSGIKDSMVIDAPKSETDTKKTETKPATKKSTLKPAAKTAQPKTKTPASKPKSKKTT